MQSAAHKPAVDFRTALYLYLATRVDGARLTRPTVRKWWWRLCRTLNPQGTIPVPLPFGCLWANSSDGVITHRLLKHGNWEPHETAVLLDHVAPGMRVVEVGANIGYHTVQLAAAVGRVGEVIAFEPDPTNRELLNLNLQEHGLADIVQVRAEAVCDHPRQAVLSLHANNLGGHSLIDANVSNIAERISVPTVALDDAIGEASVDLIKIDAEGAEPSILAGAQKIIARDRPVLFIEIWPYGLRAAGGAAMLLRQLAETYTLHRIDEATGTLSEIRAYDAAADEQDSEIAWTLLALPLTSSATPTPIR